MYYLTTFVLQFHRWVIRAETSWPTKLKYFLFIPLQKKFANSWYNIWNSLYWIKYIYFLLKLPFLHNPYSSFWYLIFFLNIVVEYRKDLGLFTWSVSGAIRKFSRVNSNRIPIILKFIIYNSIFLHFDSNYI